MFWEYGVSVFALRPRNEHHNSSIKKESSYGKLLPCMQLIGVLKTWQIVATKICSAKKNGYTTRV
jgi:hypothetical protein